MSPIAVLLVYVLIAVAVSSPFYVWCKNIKGVDSKGGLIVAGIISFIVGGLATVLFFMNILLALGIGLIIPVLFSAGYYITRPNEKAIAERNELLELLKAQQANK